MRAEAHHQSTKKFPTAEIILYLKFPKLFNSIIDNVHVDVSNEVRVSIFIHINSLSLSTLT